MPRKKLDLEKVSFRLNRGDNERLKAYFGNLGVNAGVRAIIKRHLNLLDQRAAALLKARTLAQDEATAAIPSPDMSEQEIEDFVLGLETTPEDYDADSTI